MTATPAFAQTSTESGQQSAEGEAEIVVTGSRIVRPDLESNSPIAIVGADRFQNAGKSTVEDVLNQLPQIQPGLNSNSNNPGDGTATVDLRGLGANRTLVLINGRRLVPATNDGRTDLNNIPANLIKRVDVVTGGASAVYGSDALAGVVNFILRDDFTGLELDGQYNISERGDSATYNVGGLIGTNFADDKGNITLSVNYYDRKGTFQSQRAYSAIDANGGSGTGTAGLDNSPTNPFGAFGGVAAKSNYAFNPGGTPRLRINQLPEENGGVGDRYNFAPVNYLQTPQQRLQLNVLSHYQVSDHVEAYVEGLYTDSRSTIRLAPTPATRISVSPFSPALTADARALAATRVLVPGSLAPTGPDVDLIFRRRMSDVGPRIQDFNYDVYQITTGVRGDVFGGDWKYDLYYSYGRTESTSALTNDISKARFTAGLNGCPAGSPAGCLSLGNAFGGTLTEAEADYIRIGSSVDTFNFSRQNVVGTLSGTLIELPAGPLGVSIGGEYRKDASNFAPSESSRLGDLGGFNYASPISGSFNVKEVFGEVAIPVLRDSPIGKSLSIEAGARYSDYSTVGGIFTWKAGGEYTPIDGLRLRGLYQKASRAPSVFELFQSNDQDFPTLDDPCATTLANGDAQVVPAAVATVCGLPKQLPSVDLANYGQINSQVEARNIGNQSLKAETSKTWTAGVQLSPSFIPGLNLSADYYDIRITDYIDRLGGGAESMVTGCFNSGVTTAAAYDGNIFCRNITRTASGELFVVVPLVNNATLKTTGWDFGADTSFRIGDGSRLNINANLTMLTRYEINGIRYDRLSTSDRGTLPKWRSNVRVAYVNDVFSVAANWQRSGSVNQDELDGDKIAAQDYFDLSGRVLVGEQFEFFGGVSNLLDKQPPLLTNGLGPNTDSSQYDLIGRRMFVGFKIKM